MAEYTRQTLRISWGNRPPLSPPSLQDAHATLPLAVSPGDHLASLSVDLVTYVGGNLSLPLSFHVFLFFIRFQLDFSGLSFSRGNDL